MITLDDLLPEQIWVRQPLDPECKCLPLARVKISGSFGSIVTKAAVRPADVNQGYYLMGNRTAELIEKQQTETTTVNAILTRSKAKLLETRPDELTNGKASVNKSPQLTKDEAEELSAEVESIVEDLVRSVGRDREILPPRNEEDKSLLAGVSPELFCEKQNSCPTLRDIWEKAKNPKEKEFVIENGRLARKVVSKRGDHFIQLCVPKCYRMHIMDLCHSSISGHLGVTKTKDRIIANFFWPNCYKEIEGFVRTCDTCQKIGKHRDKKKAPLKLVPIISEPFKRLSIDAIGPLIKSKKGNRYAITAICEASKYPDAIPIENLNSKEVIQALIQIFSRIGFPSEISCDLGKYFTGQLTSLFFEKYGIKVSHSSVCHPASNPVERMHGSLKHVLKALCLENGEDWEQVLPMALFALRTVTHESLGLSPVELIYGKPIRAPHTLVFENWLEKEKTDPNVVDYLLELNNRLKRCQEFAVTRMRECQNKRKKWYDRNAVTRNFKVGDQVLVLATAKPHKMAVTWLGPGTVTGIVSDRNYTVDLPEKQNKNTIYHVNLLKRYHKRPEFVNLIVEEEIEVEDEAIIPYVEANATHFDFSAFVKESDLENRLTEEEIGSLQDLLIKHENVFSNDPGTTPLVEMDIKLIDDKPVRSKAYRMSPRQTEIMKNEIKRLLDLGVIEMGQSDYASPMILVESPGKDPRPCIDYRALNAKTQIEFFPLPNIEQVVESVSAASYITVMDLTKGYFQIPLSKRAQRYAAFVTPFGSYIPKKMMFGLVNAPFYFCKLISIVLGGLEAYALPYIDDMAIYSNDWQLHLRHLNEVLKRLGDAGLKVKPAKCRFAQENVRFLGHEVGSGKRSPSDIKIQAIREFPTPKTKTQVRSFLGLTGYYARYVKSYAEKAAPLTDILKGKVRREKIEWSTECEKAFQDLKSALMESPVLYAPDFSKEFLMQTDASLVGAGVVLAQVINGEEHPIVYLSKKFSRAERNYSTIERELAAIIYGVKKLNHYLDGQHFTLQTDHNPLVYLQKMMGTNSRLTRWALCLQQYHFTIKHKAGKANANADALSRMNE